MPLAWNRIVHLHNEPSKGTGHRGAPGSGKVSWAQMHLRVQEVSNFLAVGGLRCI